MTPAERRLGWGIVATEQELKRKQIVCEQLLQRMKDIQQEATDVEGQSREELERRMVLIEAMARAIIARVEGVGDE